MTASADLFLRFGIALAMGFMIGLQREYAFREKQHDLLAGERTFALIALVGALPAIMRRRLFDRRRKARFVGKETWNCDFHTNSASKRLTRCM